MVEIQRVSDLTRTWPSTRRAAEVLDVSDGRLAFVLAATLQLACQSTEESAGRGQEGLVAAAGRVLPQRVGTSTRTRRQSSPILNRTAVLPTVPSNWVRCKEMLDDAPRY